MKKEYWAIHTNPKIWDSVLELSENFEGIFKINKKDRYDIQEDHKGILWVSGKNAGVYAFITFTSNPFVGEFSNNDLRFALDRNKFTGKHILIKVKYKKLENILIRESILQNNVLKVNYGFINPQGRRDFPLTVNEYNEILNLI